ncbi:Formylglycine-generating enzyme, required for sulfatase activity, contains SUMF1/FGE domain [Saccharopolyspora shandongensis]|uniref:Formylglycine-generating enzyme, required for sulfatase activity, contains SUMF1/FGE domain n=2 Tax=Saccharopolyspora shandongensis TaxID=418495 RepID=A0A1H3TTK8_9PSEU|nr:Formylglycine-generating enzyme, required for sulfatase activity, contains SUMF1/FGE domain [Saccharopolyspora shandongensis]
MPESPTGAEPRMIAVPGGEIVLRDEGTKTNWPVEVGDFLLAAHPVTRELYRAVTGDAPASPAGPRTPVTEVRWQDAVRFCNLLSEAAGHHPCYSIGDDPDAREVTCDWSADGFRLPTEAEWEHACRAGTSGVHYGELDEIAWYRGNSGGEVHEVATREPNAWGFHDMIGNVWEWCWDVYDPAVYGPYRVFRGGGWYDPPRGCRASCRRKSHPTLRTDDLGFRLARSR